METNETTAFAQVKIIEGPVKSLEDAIMELLPISVEGVVEVHNDAPKVRQPPHNHLQDETLSIVSGRITFRWKDESGEYQTGECKPGDRLLLPRYTLHSAVAGVDGCLYVIASHSEDS